MDYCKRIDTIRRYMEKYRVDAFITTTDANMEYLTGIPRLGGGHTRERQHSIEYACVVVTDQAVKVFMPELKFLITQAKLSNKETEAEFQFFPDGDLTGNALYQELTSIGLRGKTIGITEDLPGALVLFLMDKLDLKIINMNQAVFDMRSVKDDEEIAIIKEGVEITDRVYHGLIDAIRPGADVRELERYIDTLIEHYGANRSSFEGELNVHGPKAGGFVGFSHHTIEKGYVLGLDFGVLYKGYCTDFGRTVFIGEPSKEHVNIYDTVRAAQQAAVSVMDEKHCGEEVDNAAREIIQDTGYGRQFIHKLGHSIGMDVHERPFLAKGEKEKLKKGMIFAVEPSIYLPKNCFIRLEDEVIIGSAGAGLMSKITQDIKVIE